jgi:hypothetical protein
MRAIYAWMSLCHNKLDSLGENAESMHTMTFPIAPLNPWSSSGANRTLTRVGNRFTNYWSTCLWHITMPSPFSQVKLKCYFNVKDLEVFILTSICLIKQSWLTVLRSLTEPTTSKLIGLSCEKKITNLTSRTRFSWGPYHLPRNWLYKNVVKV